MVIEVILFVAIIACLALAIVVSILNTCKYRGWKKIYWLACSSVLTLGFLSCAYVLLFPPQYLDEHGKIIGEMPPEFSVAMMLIYSGMLIFLLGLAAMLLKRWTDFIAWIKN